jgi:hypothetical protein
MSYDRIIPGRAPGASSIADRLAVGAFRISAFPILGSLARWSADILVRLFVRLKTQADRNVGAPKQVSGVVAVVSGIFSATLAA